MATLNEIQKQIENGYISSPDDIRGILEHTLWKPAEDIDFIMNSWLGTIFKSVQGDMGKPIPEENSAVLLDVLVMADRCSINLRKMMFAKRVRLDRLSLAKKDPWFKLLLNVSVNSLNCFLKSQAPARSLKIVGVAKDYRAVFKKPLSDDVTIGGMLNGLNDTLEKSWSPGDDIEDYQASIISGCRLVQSFIHMICKGYVDVNPRASAADFPYRHLKESLWEEAYPSNRCDVSKERY